MSNNKKPLEVFLGTFSQDEEAVRLLNIYDLNDLEDDRDALLLHTCDKGWMHSSKCLIEKFLANPDSDFELPGGYVSPFHAACMSGNLDLVKYLVDKCHCDPFKANSAGLTSLQCAVKGGTKCLAVLRYLVEDSGCNALFVTSGANIMSIAFDHWSDEIMRYLIVSACCSLTINRFTGNSVLHQACIKRYITRLQFLVEKCQCDPSIRNYMEDSLLHTVCYSMQGPTDLVTFWYLIKKCNCCLNGTNVNGNTFLHTICDSFSNRGENQPNIPMIISAVCTVFDTYEDCNGNIKNADGDTILHKISKANIEEDLYKFFKILVAKYKCDPHIKNANGNTVLQILCDSMIERVCASSSTVLLLHYLLKECKVDPHIKLDNGQTNETILHVVCHAIYNFHCPSIIIDILAYLVQECGCDPHITLANGDSILHVVCNCLALKHVNQPEAVKLLYYLIEKYHVDCTVKNCKGNTVLHEICELFYSRGYDFIIAECLHTLIIKYNCDGNVIDANGDTIMHKLCKHFLRIDSSYFNYYLLKLLKQLVNECGCDPNIRTVNGDTILHIVCHFICKRQSIFNRSLLYHLIEECNCDVNMKDANGDTILHMLCKQSQKIINRSTHLELMDLLRVLITKYRCDPSIKTANGSTSLHIVTDFMHKKISNNDVELLYHLIRHCNYESNIKNEEGDTILHKLIKKGIHVHLLKLFRTLVANYNFNPHIGDAKGNTVLQILCDSVLSNAQASVAYEFQCALYYLINVSKIDPLIKLDNGQTVMNMMCRIAVKYFVCYPMIVDIITRTIENCGSNFLVLMEASNLLQIILITHLYIVAEKDVTPSVIEILYFIIFKCNLDPDFKAAYGTIILHDIANVVFTQGWCDSNIVEMLKHLINDWNCDGNSRDSNGNTISHKILKNKHSERFYTLLSILITECNCDPNIKNNNGETVFDLAWNLLCGENCNVSNVQDFLCKIESSGCKKGFTYNYVLQRLCNAVESCSNNYLTVLEKIHCLQYLLKNHDLNYELAQENGNKVLHGIFAVPLIYLNDHSFSIVEIVRYFVVECKCDLHGLVDSDNKLLNWLCDLISRGYHDCNITIEVFHYIIVCCKYSPTIERFDDGTILHFLCMLNDFSAEMKFFLYHIFNECKSFITQKDGHGNTPLHVACKNFQGDITLIELIFSTGKVDQLIRTVNYEDKTPLALLESSTQMLSYEAKQIIHSLISRFGKIKVSRPINSFVNVVLLGNPGAGKSTLAKVISSTDRNTYISKFRSVNLKKDDLLTAGIIPSVLKDKDLGWLILHDLAGHAEYYTSHTAVLDNLLQGSPAVFVIVVSLIETSFLKCLHFWLTIIENVSLKSLRQCHVVVVASHIDQTSESTATDRIAHLGQVLTMRLARVPNDELTSHGVFKLDCRKLSGNRLNTVISELLDACQSVRTESTREMTLYCHMLYDFFQNHNQCIYLLQSLSQLIKEKNNYFLPTNLELLTDIVSELNLTGLIAFFRNSKYPGDSYIVANKSVLLSELDGIIFAPEHFKEYANLSSNTGITRLSCLTQHFRNIDPNLIVQFLHYMELCHEMSKDFLLSAGLIPHSDDDDERYLFIPALIKDTKRPDVSEIFQFGWCIQCLDEHSFFVPRFLHVLLLHLAYKHAVEESANNKLQRLVKIWNTGIYWKDKRGVQTLVELIDNNQCLLLLMSCKEGTTLDMISLRQSVIGEILLLKFQLCPRVKTSEFIIDPSTLNYPVIALTDLYLYNIEMIAKCDIEECQYALNTTGEKQTLLSDLFKDATLNTHFKSIFANRTPKDIAEGKLQFCQSSCPLNSASASVTQIECKNNDSVTKGSPHSSNAATQNPVDKGPQVHSSFNTQTKPPSEILKEYTPRLLKSISEPKKLATDLWSVNLISEAVKGRVETTPSLSDYDRANTILDEVRRSLVVNENARTFKQFCHILKQHGNIGLQELAEEMVLLTERFHSLL